MYYYKLSNIGIINLVLIVVFSSPAWGVRVKDIAGLRGARDNELIGFGIVVGLDGTGESQESLLSRKPIINALTNHSHPCQVIADLITFKEKFGDFKNKKVSWFGDYNNVTQSWVEAAALLDINLPLMVLAFVSEISNLKSRRESFEFSFLERA